MTLGKGTIGIPNSYFLKMAKHDYEDYKSALPREFYQNSIDAGAKNILVTRTDNCITISDDGCGMTLDILKNKLLVLGGSHKASGSVGAFGKAKELLFFSWEYYTIQTGNLLVEGKGAEYTITETPERVKGTSCHIYLPDSEDAYSVMDRFTSVARLMQTRTKIYVDDTRITCDRKRGKAVRQIDGVGVIHQVKKRSSNSMSVRINGIWMFSQYVGSSVGELVLELDGKSVDVLTSNRDGFKWETRSKVSQLLEDLNTNKAAALKKQRSQIKVNIPGNGKITVGEDQLALAKSKVDMGANLMAIIDQVWDVAEDERLSAIQEFRIKNAAKITEVEWDDFKKHIEFIGYEPDFTLLHEEGKEDSVAKFMTTKKARLLATMWTEVIKQVLMDNKRYLKFTAGFVFDKDKEAMISHGDVTIYLNPNLIKTSEHRRIIMEDLKDLAIHEIAHLRVSNHDADFVNEMADIRKNVTRADQKSYSDIQRTKA